MVIMVKVQDVSNQTSLSEIMLSICQRSTYPCIFLILDLCESKIFFKSVIKIEN